MCLREPPVQTRRLTSRVRLKRRFLLFLAATTLIMIGGCNGKSRNASTIPPWKEWAVPTANYSDMSIVCQPDYGSLHTGGAHQPIANIYIKLQNGNTYFLPDFSEADAEILLEAYGHEWQGKSSKSRKYFKGGWHFAFNGQGRLIRSDLDGSVTSFSFSRNKQGPFVQAGCAPEELIAAMGVPDSWSAGNISGMFSLRDGKRYHRDAVPSAVYDTFDVDCDPIYGTISVWGAGGKNPQPGDGIPKVYVKFATGDQFYLPDLPESFIAWLLDKRHVNLNLPKSTEVDYGDGQSMFSFVNGRLSTLHVTAPSKLMSVSVKPGGPYFPINMSREEIIDVFGPPKAWLASEPSGRF